MKWFLAKMIYRIICGNGNHMAQFDEQLRLIAATDLADAFQKANDMGYKEEDSFYNRQEQLVRWKFITVSELYPFNTFIDGAELFSKIKEVENAEAYLTFVQQKAAFIQNEYACQPLNSI